MEQPPSREDEPELPGLAPYERQTRERRGAADAEPRVATLPIKLPSGQISHVKRVEAEQVSCTCIAQQNPCSGTRPGCDLPLFSP